MLDIKYINALQGDVICIMILHAASEYIFIKNSDQQLCKWNSKNNSEDCFAINKFYFFLNNFVRVQHS